MKKSENYADVYRGVAIEATNWRYSGETISKIRCLDPTEDHWCGYIYLDSKHHPEITSFEVDYRKYTDHVPFFDELPFHGGVTYSEVTKHREFLRMKIGCDYQHYYDENVKYTEADVLNDLKKVVDQYREKFWDNISA